MYKNRDPFDASVLVGPTAADTASIGASYRRVFSTKFIRIFAEKFRLTERETEALVLTMKGVSDANAGKALGLSPYTVRLHRSRMYGKVGVTSAERLVMKYILMSGLCLLDAEREMLGIHDINGRR